MTCQLFNEDCLEGMRRLADGSVDMILTDLPYGITNCDFDVRIPFEPMWEQFKRVTKRNAAIVLFSQMPFGAELIMSNRGMFRYKWCWLKNCGTGFLNANKMPLKTHEDILIFYAALPIYNPQFTQGRPHRKVHRAENMSRNYQKMQTCVTVNDGTKYYPHDVIIVPSVNCGGARRTNVSMNFHPQQKPVDLLEYLIRTYTNEGETVLDATMGSGSTGVAAINTNRKFIGFETEKNFFTVAQKRINEAIAQREQSLF